MSNKNKRIKEGIRDKNKKTPFFEKTRFL